MMLLDKKKVRVLPAAPSGLQDKTVVLSVTPVFYHSHIRFQIRHFKDISGHFTSLPLGEILNHENNQITLKYFGTYRSITYMMETG